MGGKGRDAYPGSILGFLCQQASGQLAEVWPIGIDGLKLQLHGIAQSFQYLGVVLEGGRLLRQPLVVVGSEQSLAVTVLVDMLHAVTVQVEADAQIVGTEYVVEVGDGGELLGYQPAIERVQSFYAFVLPFDVRFHEANVGCQVLKERLGERPTQHGNAQMWVLPGQ